MRAYRRDRYGSPDTLALREVERPAPVDDQVLVRVHASSVNAHDWHMLRGKPYIARLGEGLRRPKNGQIGLDVAGVVEGIGPGVTDLAIGDRVFGTRGGAFGEYVAGRNMVAMPEGLTFAEAAALPVAGITALQAVRDRAKLRPGDRVLVNGAGGGVGSLVVQIAKAYGADVTAVTSSANLELAASLGAGRVIDYMRDDFTRLGSHDAVIDLGGNRSLRALRRAITPGGRLVMIAPAPGNWIGPIARIVGAVIASRLSSQQLGTFLSSVSREDLAALRELVEAGKVRPVIDRAFGFDEVPAAIEYMESGRSHGKIVVEVVRE